jgi:hypothetical protein
MKKPRFFGCAEIFGDGVSMCYIGSTPEEVKDAFDIALKESENRWEEQDDIVKVIMMTDEELEKLPML